MQILYIVIFVVLSFALFVMPFDWWQKAPSRQKDKLIGKLLGSYLDTSFRNMLCRLVIFSGLFIAFLVGLLFMPLLILVMTAIVIPTLLRQRMKGDTNALKDPVIGLLVVMLLGTVFAFGLLAVPKSAAMVLFFLLGKPAGGLLEALVIDKVLLNLDVFIGLVGMFGVAVWLFVDAAWRLRQARQVDNLPASKIRSAAVGLVELRGIARSFSGEHTAPILRAHTDLFRKDNADQRVDMFYLEDGTGRILVDPRTCTIRAGWLSGISSILGMREIVLTKKVFRDDRDDSVIKQLGPGDRVYLIGNADLRHDASPSAVGPDRLVIRPTSGRNWTSALWHALADIFHPVRGKDIQDVFFLTDAPEADAKKHIMKGFRVVFLLGLLWLIASVTLLWSTSRPFRQDYDPESWRGAYWRGKEPNPNPIVLDYSRNQRLFRFERYIKSLKPDSLQAVPALIEAIGYKDYRFYAPAASALLKIRHADREQLKAALPLLIGHLHPCSYNAESLQMTILAIGAFGPDAAPAVPALLEQLNCRSTSTYVVPAEFIRLQTVHTLGCIGPAATAAVPALREALNDSAGYVRQASAQALRKITGEIVSAPTISQ